MQKNKLECSGRVKGIRWGSGVCGTIGNGYSFAHAKYGAHSEEKLVFRDQNVFSEGPLLESLRPVHPKTKPTKGRQGKHRSEVPVSQRRFRVEPRRQGLGGHPRLSPARSRDLVTFHFSLAIVHARKLHRKRQVFKQMY